MYSSGLAQGTKATGFCLWEPATLMPSTPCHHSLPTFAHDPEDPELPSEDWLAHKGLRWADEKPQGKLISALAVSTTAHRWTLTFRTVCCPPCLAQETVPAR